MTAMDSKKDMGALQLRVEAANHKNARRLGMFEDQEKEIAALDQTTRTIIFIRTLTWTRIHLRGLSSREPTHSCLSWTTIKKGKRFASPKKALFNDNKQVFEEDLTKLLQVFKTATVVKTKHEIVIKLTEDCQAITTEVVQCSHKKFSNFRLLKHVCSAL